MFAQQGMPEVRNRPADGLITRRFDGQIAFGIESHGTVAEIRRSDTNDLIVDDADLAVHADALTLQIRNPGIIEIQAMKFVRRMEALEHTASENVHGVLFQPSVAVRM